MFDDDAMPVLCRCGEWFDLGGRYDGFACDRCGEVLCHRCLPGTREPRLCDACEDDSKNERQGNGRCRCAVCGCFQSPMMPGDFCRRCDALGRR